MQIKKVGMLVLIGMFLVSLASASLDFSKVSLKTDYGGGDLISGNFNLDFVNQTNLLFTSSFGGSKSLYALVKDSGYIRGIDFKCSPSDCNPVYTYSSGESSKNIPLGNNQNLYGFVVNGNNIVLRNLSFQISSDIGESCLNQLSLDLFDDGSADFYNTNYVLDSCGDKKYGCFDSSLINGEGELSSSPYCEKIVLPSAPAYNVGARIKNSTNRFGAINMEMYLENSPSNRVGKCTLPNLTSSVQERECAINYSSTKQINALVCVSVSNGANYKISLSGGTKCGKVGAESEGYTTNYEVYAQPLKYDLIQKTFDSNLYSKLRSDSENGLIDEIQLYLDKKYGNNCENGCVIPLSLAGPSQTVKISNIELKYNNDGAIGQNNNLVYRVDSDKMKMSSLKTLTFNFEKLGIKTSSVSGNRTFELFFDLNKLTSYDIRISSGFGFDISPKYAFIGQNIPFNVILPNNYTYITSSNWDFGDGKTAQSSSGKITHSYSSNGSYDIVVKVVKSDAAVSTKTFRINVGNIYESARLMIAADEARISNISLQMNSFDAWVKSEVEKRANITKISSDLASIKRTFEGTNKNNSDALQTIVSQLVKLDVPYSIVVGQKGSNIPLEIGLQNADLSYIKTLSSNSAGLDDSDLRTKVSDWMDNNYNSNIGFEEISRFGDSGMSAIVTKFSISASPKNNAEGYLIIDYPFDSILFKENYGQKTVGNGVYIPISGAKNIEFIIPGKIKVSEIGAYISPDINKLGVVGTIGHVTNEFNWSIFLTGLLVLLVVAGIVFYFGRRWYIYNYESHLFKNPKDLNNLILFIVNARNKGLSDVEIRKKLKSVGWNYEQIDYSMGKIKSKTSKVY